MNALQEIHEFCARRQVDGTRFALTIRVGVCASKFKGVIMKRQKGVLLVERLIVVAIILIIAAIAIPNLLRSKMAANESSAAASVRSIVTSQVTYNSTYGIGYAASLKALGSGATVPCTATSAAACLLDSVLSSGTKTGFTVARVGTGLTLVAMSVHTTATVP